MLFGQIFGRLSFEHGLITEQGIRFLTVTIIFESSGQRLSEQFAERNSLLPGEAGRLFL
jgi:hypothetical protein